MHMLSSERVCIQAGGGTAGRLVALSSRALPPHPTPPPMRGAVTPKRAARVVFHGRLETSTTKSARQVGEQYCSGTPARPPGQTHPHPHSHPHPPTHWLCTRFRGLLGETNDYHVRRVTTLPEQLSAPFLLVYVHTCCLLVHKTHLRHGTLFVFAERSEFLFRR